MPNLFAPLGWGGPRVTEPQTPEEAAQARRIPPWVLNQADYPPPYSAWDSTLELAGWAAIGVLSLASRAASGLMKLSEEAATPGTGLFFVANDPALGPIALAVGAFSALYRANKVFKGLSLGTDLWRGAETLEDLRFAKGPVFFDVVVHGAEYSARFGEETAKGLQVLTPAELAALIRKAGWSGQPIRLIACTSAACKVEEAISAQAIANLLGTPVLAPLGRPGFIVGIPDVKMAFMLPDRGKPYRIFVPQR